jgi:hypothetical protein
MHSCSHIEMDDYPCLEEGTVRVGDQWYCAEHALEAEAGEQPYADEMNMFDHENSFVTAPHVSDNDMVDY